MPSFIDSQSAGVLVNEYDLTSYFTKVESTGERAMHDVTVLGQASRAFRPGLRSGGFLAEGFYDQATAAASDSVLSPLLTASAVPLVAGAPQGFAAVGNRVYLLEAHSEKYALGVKVGEFVSNMASFRSDDGYDGGVLLQALSAVTATGNGTTHDSGASSANGGVAHLHVTAISGSPSVVWKVQHSTDGSTWADLATFTAATAATSQRVTVAAATTVNRYLRAVRTFTGGSAPSITAAVAFARR